MTHHKGDRLYAKHGVCVGCLVETNVVSYLVDHLVHDEGTIGQQEDVADEEYEEGGVVVRAHACVKPCTVVVIPRDTMVAQ